MILMKKYKSQGIGFLLTGLLGSVGLFYSSITGAMIMMVIEFISSYLYVQYVINAFKLYYMPNYHLGEFILFLIVLRIISFIITYSSIKEYNTRIDAEILMLSESTEEKEKQEEVAKQLDDANNYINYDKAKSDTRTGTIIVVVSFVVIITLILIISQNYNTHKLSEKIESPQPNDIENHDVYQIKSDSAWIYCTPNENDNSGSYYEKNMIFEAIKQRDSFIYISGSDGETHKTVYGWLKTSDLEDLSGCMH